MQHKGSLILTLILFSTFTICLPIYADDSTIYGCYKKKGGQLRIVSQGSRCLPSEVPISWNQAGSPGPAGPTGTGASVTVRQINPCTGEYGWCPDGFTWYFQILDSTVNESSVVAINIVSPLLNDLSPLLNDYGCEVGRKEVGKFEMFCIGLDSVVPGAILQYAVFNP